MKKHTADFKEQIKLFGRELDSKISYTIDENTIVLTSEQLNSIIPTYQGNILKSVMKELEIDSDINIPIGTIINYQFGLKINEEYEYLDYGNYVVHSSEKQEDTNSYKIHCYDKILYSMKQNENLEIEYPITIRNYINTLCNKIGLTFADKDKTFVNYDKLIEKELYLGLDYTYRDILDELAQVTASSICINKNDELEIRYINDTEDIIDEEYLKDVNVRFRQKYGPINSIVLSRSAESDNIYLRNEESVNKNGLCEIKIIDNQIMNWNNRDEFLPGILEKLDGLEYYINDFSSTGIMYYDLCDKYYVSIDKYIYPCIMFNDEPNITQGLLENIFTDMPNESETDYQKADKTDRKINQVYIIADKQGKKIEALISETSENTSNITKLEMKTGEIEASVEETNENLVTQISKVSQNINNVQNLFQITGGNNLIKNSVGIFEDDYWEKSENGIFEFGADDSLIGITTSISKISVSNGTLKTTVDNIKGLTLNEIKTLSYKVKQDDNTTTTIKLYGLSENSPLYTKTFTGAIDRWTDIYDENLNSFTSDSPNLILKIESSSTYDGKFYISDLMLNNGDKSEWQMAPGESNGTIIKLSQLGISVYGLESDTLTMMTKQGLQIRSLHGTSISDIITEFTKNGMITVDIEQSGKHIQKKLVHDFIRSGGHDVYIEYIKE